jgi:hypothetical protein
LFLGPLLIVHKSPPAASARIKVAVAKNDVVFNETYYGYSAREHPHGDQLIRYLALLLSSKVALWLALMTSGEFGFEREVVEKTTIDKLPIPRFEQLAPADLALVDQLFEAIAGDSKWSEVDAFAAKQYGLQPHEVEVIRDTLQFNLPYAENRSEAQQPPNQTVVQQFCDILSAELRPWSERYARPAAKATPNAAVASSPWRVLRLSFSGPDGGNDAYATDWPAILHAADEMAATEVVCSSVPDRALWIGRLNQARYWSPTQARLVAQRVIWSHIDLLADHG